jgi:hypothetical protein
MVANQLRHATLELRITIGAFGIRYIYRPSGDHHH